ncbi:MAG: hypothetical protein COA79_21810 [Planctomycetota bacterium]|nr:MAG: hypothetical protein COA79_21810 [Planctomycetota bacterium]
MNSKQNDLKLLYPYLTFSVMLYFFAEVFINYKVHLLGREDNLTIYMLIPPCFVLVAYYRIIKYRDRFFAVFLVLSLFQRGINNSSSELIDVYGIHGIFFFLSQLNIAGVTVLYLYREEKLRKNIIKIDYKKISEELEEFMTDNLKPNRIYFLNNPWPEGHPIKQFDWETKIVDNDVWFHFHLESEDYDSEREIDDNVEEEDDEDDSSDWEASIVWNNYHSCTLSSNDWHDGGFKICSIDDYNIEKIDGLEIDVDMSPEEFEDHDDSAFHIYLCGHDSVAYHHINFQRIDNSDYFDIHWKGRIALTYSGEEEFEHEFCLIKEKVKFPSIK